MDLVSLLLAKKKGKKGGSPYGRSPSNGKNYSKSKLGSTSGNKGELPSFMRSTNSSKRKTASKEDHQEIRWSFSTISFSGLRSLPDKVHHRFTDEKHAFHAKHHHKVAPHTDHFGSKVMAAAFKQETRSEGAARFLAGTGSKRPSRSYPIRTISRPIYIPSEYEREEKARVEFTSRRSVSQVTNREKAGINAFAARKSQYDEKNLGLPWVHEPYVKDVEKELKRQEYFEERRKDLFGPIIPSSTTLPQSIRVKHQVDELINHLIHVIRRETDLLWSVLVVERGKKHISVFNPKRLYKDITTFTLCFIHPDFAGKSAKTMPKGFLEAADNMNIPVDGVESIKKVPNEKLTVQSEEGRLSQLLQSQQQGIKKPSTILGTDDDATARDSTNTADAPELAHTVVSPSVQAKPTLSPRMSQGVHSSSTSSSSLASSCVTSADVSESSGQEEDGSKHAPERLFHTPHSLTLLLKTLTHTDTQCCRFGLRLEIGRVGVRMPNDAMVIGDHLHGLLHKRLVGCSGQGPTWLHKHDELQEEDEEYEEDEEDEEEEESSDYALGDDGDSFGGKNGKKTSSDDRLIMKDLMGDDDAVSQEEHGASTGPTIEGKQEEFQGGDEDPMLDSMSPTSTNNQNNTHSSLRNSCRTEKKRRGKKKKSTGPYPGMFIFFGFSLPWYTRGKDDVVRLFYTTQKETVREREHAMERRAEQEQMEREETLQQRYALSGWSASQSHGRLDSSVTESGRGYHGSDSHQQRQGKVKSSLSLPSTLPSLLCPNKYHSSKKGKSSSSQSKNRPKKSSSGTRGMVDMTQYRYKVQKERDDARTQQIIYSVSSDMSSTELLTPRRTKSRSGSMSKGSNRKPSRCLSPSILASTRSFAVSNTTPVLMPSSSPSPCPGTLSVGERLVRGDRMCRSPCIEREEERVKVLLSKNKKKKRKSSSGKAAGDGDSGVVVEDGSTRLQGQGSARGDGILYEDDGGASPTTIEYKMKEVASPLILAASGHSASGHSASAARSSSIHQDDLSSEISKSIVADTENEQRKKKKKSKKGSSKTATIAKLSQSLRSSNLNLPYYPKSGHSKKKMKGSAVLYSRRVPFPATSESGQMIHSYYSATSNTLK
ncbi:hypothetical protein ADUPG1_008101 [Aduncisulcus paluster]|uniref:Uncharacterized protein n=1 Tax=Aduncisulcus paluster TaxID=2918883 RepID=A0ABQ5KQQ9_9EUKA|nr:hypothetical protein ADUPG1_008101 [Aduncisulcus paluster]